MTNMKRHLAAILVFAVFAFTAVAQPDALHSWNDAKSKKTIKDFVAKVTIADSPESAKGWTVVDLEKERNAVFPFERVRN